MGVAYSVAGGIKNYPLDGFPAVRADLPEEAEDSIRRIYGARHVEFPAQCSTVSVHANHWASANLAISYCHYETSARAEFPEASFVRLQLPLSGETQARVGREWRPITSDLNCVIPAETTLLNNFPAHYRQLVLRLETDALTAKLAAMLGAPPTQKLELERAVRLSQLSLLQRTLLFLIGELDGPDSSLPPVVLAELEQSILVAFLCGTPHNYSSLLNDSPATPSSRQVRLAEEYITGHWQEPITIESLARETQVSARTLFHHFKQSRGQTPMEFLKQIRLLHARDMLLDTGRETSVSAAARACGFGNLGHFAKDYGKRFGERPSETRKRVAAAAPQPSPARSGIQD